MFDTLRDAFLPLYKKEAELNEIIGKMAEATPEELEVLLEQMADIQDALDAGDFYTLDMKIEEIATWTWVRCNWLRSSMSKHFLVVSVQRFYLQSYY